MLGSDVSFHSLMMIDTFPVIFTISSPQIQTKNFCLFSEYPLVDALSQKYSFMFFVVFISSTGGTKVAETWISVYGYQMKGENSSN